MSVLKTLINVLKLASLHKNDVIITKTKVKAYILNTKFLLMNSLINAFRALISKTLKIIIQNQSR